jgi:hypothetical protein
MPAVFLTQFLTQFTVPTGKMSEPPRGMLLVTRLLASNKQAWESMASSSAIFLSKTAHRTPLINCGCVTGGGRRRYDPFVCSGAAVGGTSGGCNTCAAFGGVG